MKKQRTVAPSDSGTLRGSRARIGGRVIAKSDDEIVLADAFAQVSIAGSLDLEEGDLAVIDVRKTPQGLLAEDLVETHRPLSPPAPGQGETHRPLSPPAPGQGETRRLIYDRVGVNLVARTRILTLTRRYFESERFLEVDTPLVVPSPGLDLHLDAMSADSGFLITSPEYQMKRLIAGGIPRAFQITHVFRRDELGARHNPEFTMLEWYRAFAEVEDVMADTENLVAGIVHALTGGIELVVGDKTIDCEPPFERLPVAEAFERFADTSQEDALRLAETDEDAFFRLLVEKVEPALATIAHPVFLTDYPISQASLARAKPSGPRVAERFELYVGGIELCNGFGELTDAKEQRARFERDQKARADLGKPVYPIDERFLAALEEGMPPSAGNALGLDRLVALVTGESEIARVMPFPASWL